MELIKRTCILIIEINKRVSFLLYSVFPKRNRKLFFFFAALETAFIEYTLSSHRQFQHQLKKKMNKIRESITNTDGSQHHLYRTDS